MSCYKCWKLRELVSGVWHQKYWTRVDNLCYILDLILHHYNHIFRNLQINMKALSVSFSANIYTLNVIKLNYEAGSVAAMAVLLQEQDILTNCKGSPRPEHHLKVGRTAEAVQMSS
jgi:hypothetical protein